MVQWYPRRTVIDYARSNNRRKNRLKNKVRMARRS